MTNYYFLVFLLTTLSFVSADHILFVHICSTYSHRPAQWPLVEGLLKAGHQITFISVFGPSGPNFHSNVTEIQPKALHDLGMAFLEENFDVNYRIYGVLPPLFLVMDVMCYQLCHTALTSPEIQGWLKTNPKVDLVVSDMVAECGYGLTVKFGAKNVLFSPIPLVTKYYEAFGLSLETNSIPDFDVTRTVPLSFLSRVTGALLPLWYRALDALIHPFYKSLYKQTLGLEEFPGVYEVKDRTNLVMINGDYVSEYARSFAPFVVKVEGLHIKRESQIKSPSKEVESFIFSKNPDGSNNEGFIFMSFGTVAKAPNLPLSMREIFFSVISSFPEIRFIWKWDGKKPEIYPKNLLLVPWVDQQDLLAHPKIRAFITQAGRPSTQEALYFKVPTITFPILGDQDFNAQRHAALGISIIQDFSVLTTENLRNAIEEILTSPKYKSRVTQISNLIKDVQKSPVDTAVWWLEFVLRHTKEELDLLKPISGNLNWIQKRDLDVWSFLFVLTSIIAYATFYICKIIYSRLANKFLYKNFKMHASGSKKVD